MFGIDYELIVELEHYLVRSSLKNYTNEVKEGNVNVTTPYVEINCNGNRFVFKKTSLCWLFKKESYKCSSDKR